MQLVILEGTGSGKGTQTAKIGNNFSILSVSTGKILRTGIFTGSDFGKQAQACVDRGELVPNKLMIQFINDF